MSWLILHQAVWNQTHPTLRQSATLPADWPRRWLRVQRFPKHFHSGEYVPAQDGDQEPWALGDSRREKMHQDAMASSDNSLGEVPVPHITVHQDTLDGDGNQNWDAMEKDHREV